MEPRFNLVTDELSVGRNLLASVMALRDTRLLQLYVCLSLSLTVLFALLHDAICVFVLKNADMLSSLTCFSFAAARSTCIAA